MTQGRRFKSCPRNQLEGRISLTFFDADPASFVLVVRDEPCARHRAPENMLELRPSVGSGDQRRETVLRLFPPGATYEHRQAKVSMTLDQARRGMLAHLNEGRDATIHLEHVRLGPGFAVAETILEYSVEGKPVKRNGVDVRVRERQDYPHRRISGRPRMRRPLPGEGLSGSIPRDALSSRRARRSRRPSWRAATEAKSP